MKSVSYDAGDMAERVRQAILRSLQAPETPIIFTAHEMKEMANYFTKHIMMDLCLELVPRRSPRKKAR